MDRDKNRGLTRGFGKRMFQRILLKTAKTVSKTHILRDRTKNR